MWFSNQVFKVDGDVVEDFHVSSEFFGGAMNALPASLDGFMLVCPLIEVLDKGHGIVVGFCL